MKYYEVKFIISAPDGMMQDARDILMALAGEAGFETFEETEQGVTGYVQQALFQRERLGDTLSFFPIESVRVDYEVAEAEDRDWNEQWEQEGFEPIVIDRRCVVHDGRRLGNCSLSEYPLAIEIDAHLAFGTGTHESTRMMVGSLLELDLNDKRVLDCGCGTGILGIAALMNGAREAVGYDIDEWSVDNARHNAVINQVNDRYTALLGDVHVLNKVDGTFDVVLANINRNILLADMPVFREKLADGGWLLLSGFYAADIPLLTDKAEGLGLKLVKTCQDGEWQCITFVALLL